LGRLHGGFFDACFLRLSPLRFDGFVRCFDAFDEGADGSVTLTNGIRIVTVYFPGSTNESIFTYLPMSLTSDGPPPSQWAHGEEPCDAQVRDGCVGAGLSAQPKPCRDEGGHSESDVGRN